MATARDIVTRSMRLIGALAAGETASAEDASDGLDALNGMLHGWAVEGVDLIHTTLALTDTLLVEDAFLEGIRYNLAIRLAPEFGAVVPSHVPTLADEAFKAFQAHNLEFDDELKPDFALHPRFSTRRIGAYDIDQG